MNILGIDIGGSGIKAAPVNLETGAFAEDRLRIATPQPATPDAVAQIVRELAAHFDWDGPIGCAFPALVQRGTALTATNIDPAWIGTSVEKVFGKATGCPVYAVNDADAAGLAEVTYGAGRGVDGVVLLVTVGTGIGSALFVNGTLVPNTEFGHLLYQGDIIERYAADRVRKEQDLKWSQWAERFQVFLDYIERLVSPDLIILGGGTSRPKKFKKIAPLLTTRARFVAAELENTAGIVGAAAFAKRRS